LRWDIFFASRPAQSRNRDSNGVHGSGDIALWRPSWDVRPGGTSNGLQPGSIRKGILQDRCKCLDIAAGKDKLWSNRSDKIARGADAISKITAAVRFGKPAACNVLFTLANAFLFVGRR
jgi:hypothetical protein